MTDKNTFVFDDDSPIAGDFIQVDGDIVFIKSIEQNNGKTDLVVQLNDKECVIYKDVRPISQPLVDTRIQQFHSIEFEAYPETE